VKSEFSIRRQTQVRKQNAVSGYQHESGIRQNRYQCKFSLNGGKHFGKAVDAAKRHDGADTQYGIASVVAVPARHSQNSIPYHIKNGMTFYQRREVKILLDYLRLIHDPGSVEGDDALKNVINAPNRYMGKKFMTELKDYAQNENHNHLYEALNTDFRNKYNRHLNITFFDLVI
jgi:hypothetical protein